MTAQIKVIAAMFIFGSMGLLIRNIPLPSSTIALIRGFIGVLFLIIVNLSLKKHISKTAIARNRVILFLSGNILGANWIFLFEAYKYTTIATATLSYYLAPVFVMALSPLILKENITSAKMGCILASLIGMVLVSGAFTNPLQGTSDFIGIGYGIAAALSYASLTFLNKFTLELSSAEATIAQLGIAFIVLLPYVLCTENLGNIAWGTQTFLLLVTLGVIHTGLAFWLYFSSLQELKAQTVAAFSYVDPVTAILLSALVLQEKMELTQILGAILILGSTLLCEFF